MRTASELGAIKTRCGNHNLWCVSPSLLVLSLKEDQCFFQWFIQRIRSSHTYNKIRLMFLSPSFDLPC